MLELDLGMLGQILVWLITGGGAGVVVFYGWEIAEREWPALGEMAPHYERYATIGLVFVVAVGAYLASVWLGYEAAPADARGWIEAIVSVAGVALPTSLALHGEKKRRVERDAVPAG